MQNQDPKDLKIDVNAVIEAEKKGIRISSGGVQIMEPVKVVNEDRDAIFKFFRKAYNLQPKEEVPAT